MKYNNLYVELIAAGCHIIRHGAIMIFGLARLPVTHGQYHGMEATKYRKALNEKSER